MRYESVIDDVPEYRGFMTVDELNESSRMLAQQHPDDVDLFKIGSSRRGDPIYALKVGEGALKAVLIGFPHPNEPIGSLTIEYLSKRLVEDDLLREELNFTWYFVKVSDVDGARLNEGWFKGKYDNLTHMLNFYRTPSSKQVEWTFPIEYKTLKWDGIPPETRSIMNLIDLVKPNFVFTLHNSAFGGVYFYVSDPCPRLYPRLKELAKNEDLPLHLGEPETPYMRKLDDAIFLLPPIEEIYDFYENHSDRDPAAILSHGASSRDYSKRVSNAFSIVCEMPYIFDERIVDLSPSGMMRRTAVLKGIGISEEVYRFVKAGYKEVERGLIESSPFYEVISEYLETYGSRLDAYKRWAKTDESLERPATVSEVFDSLVIRKYYGMRMLGQFIRLIDESIMLKQAREEALLIIRERSLEKLVEMNSEVEKEAMCTIIPIQKLVRVQVGAALHVADYVLQSIGG